MFGRVGVVLAATGVSVATIGGNQVVLAQEGGAASYAAVAGQIGGQDILGGYEVAADWPKEISDLPGHGDWTWGAGQSIYAESADRVYGLMRGELPNIERPSTRFLSDIAPSLSFPIGRLPWRDATAASLPANGGFQKYTPREGANSDMLVGPPVRSAWE